MNRAISHLTDGMLHRIGKRCRSTGGQELPVQIQTHHASACGDFSNLRVGQMSLDRRSKCTNI